MYSQVPTLPQAKMARQSKQERVGARKGFFSCHSVTLVLLANSDRYEVDTNALFVSGKILYPLRVLSICCVSTLTFFDEHSYL
jgi:hypothetical protein